MVDVHPTAVISPGAQIGEGCQIGPFCYVGPKVKIGSNNKLRSHVVLDGNTTLGDKNELFPFCAVGTTPQDLKYSGEDSVLEIGSNNIIRESATIQPGTKGGGMITKIGDHNMFMAYSHVAHDCRLGNRNILANSVAIAGHVLLGNGVIIGGLAAIHQFVRLGDLSFIGGGAMVVKDVPPFLIAQGDRAGLVGVNAVGMTRGGFDKNSISLIRSTYRGIFLESGTFKEKIEKHNTGLNENPALKLFIEFLLNSQRGVSMARKEASQDMEG